MRVQSLRTLPSHRLLNLSTEPVISFAPDGICEIQLALQKAIAAAEVYIYVEDQKIESRELFGYLKTAVQANSDLKIILLTGQIDPADRPTQTRARVIRDYLTTGLTPSQLDRIVFFQHQRAIVHSKLWLIDDHFALIGSANFSNRSLFTDIEHCVSFVDDGAGNACVDARRRLWGEHFRLPPDERGELNNLEVALNIWNPNWLPLSSGARPTFTLPIYAADAANFTKPWGDDIAPDIKTTVVRQTPALVEMKAIPKRTAAGEIDTVVRGGRQYFVQRTWNGQLVPYTTDPAVPPENRFLPPEDPPPDRIVAAGADFIEDTTLPFADPVSRAGSLVDEWIIFFGAVESGELRKIRTHVGHRIAFDPLSDPISTTTLDYGLLTPALKRLPLPPPVDPLLILGPNYFVLDDRGEVPC